MKQIRDVMKTGILSLDGERTVHDACTLMGKRHIGSLVITMNGKPYGIFTERDLLSKVILNDVNMAAAPIRDYVSMPLVTIKPDFGIREAARIMSDLKIKRLLVLEDEEIIGIFTASDLADVMAEAPLDF